jgi:hypothetical protein
MYVCDVCGRKINKKICLRGYTLCSKHMHQLYKYGKFLDNIQRTNSDLNDYTIDRNEQTACFNMYNQKNLFTKSFIIDLEDIEKVKYHKWRLGNNSYPITGLPAKKTVRTVGHVILGLDSRDTGSVIDHINGNTLDNRKSNLRIITQQQNLLNKGRAKNTKSPFKGVYKDKSRNQWASEISLNGIKVHFTRQDDLKVAAYQRYIAESVLFKEFSRKEELDKIKKYTENLPKQEKEKIKLYVINKLHKYNLC